MNSIDSNINLLVGMQIVHFQCAESLPLQGCPVSALHAASLALHPPQAPDRETQRDQPGRPADSDQHQHPPQQDPQQQAGLQQCTAGEMCD